MIKLKLYPPSGTIEDAKALKFEVSGVEVDSIRVSIENATHGTSGVVTSLQNMGDGSYMGFANIKVPAHLTHSMISIFAHVEERLEDGLYKTIQICPSIFTVINDTEGISEPLSVYPSFIGPEDMCSVRVQGKPNSKKIVSINDKFFRTTINKDGLGSVSFKGVDVIGYNDIDTVYQLPIYLYDEADNFTKKVFSDSYLSVLPSTLAMHADPRCIVGDDAYVIPPWALPDACLVDPDVPILDPLIPVIPPTALPTTCKEDLVYISGSKTCKIFSHSATVLNNGMVIHAYLSPDKTVTNSDADEFNMNKIFVAQDKSAFDVRVIANSDVAVEPKAAGENFIIHVQEDVYDAMQSADDTSANDIYVVLFDSAIGFQRIEIIDRTLDEYTGSYTLIGQMEDDFLLIRDWIFCVNAVFYHASESPVIIDTDLLSVTGYSPTPSKSGYVVDSDDNVLQAVNVSVSSNSKNADSGYGESYIYFVIEAIINNESQLFFTSTYIAQYDDVTSVQTTPFIQLTDNGNNQNPVAKIGSDNNLHVTWESDRAGIKQVYYGVIGLSVVSFACPAFSASIDKYSEFLSRSDVPFDYLSANFLSPIDEHAEDPSTRDAEWGSSELLDSPSWDTYGFTGDIAQSSNATYYINDLTITGNPLTQDAMAFQSIQIVDPLDDPSNENPSTESIPYSQYNYQIDFNLIAGVAQDSRLATIYEGTVIDEREMDNIFNDWKGEFALSIHPYVDNQPLYVKDGQSFVVGRVDNIFDRIVPIVGSYKLGFENPSVDRFQIDITNTNNNLKDFTFGLMFEKTRFTATNINTSAEFADNPSDYVESEVHTIYTGMAKLVAFIKTEDVEVDRANYIIVREFPEKLDLTVESNYTIIVNYTAIDSDGVTTLLSTYEQTYDYKFMGQITLLIDTVPRFSQSFIATISDAYNYFDIGFGIPYGGYYIADKMSPSKLGIYDNLTTSLFFTDISITSPTWVPNESIINLDKNIRDMTDFRVKITEPSSPGGGTVPIHNPIESKNLLYLAGRDVSKYMIFVQRSDSSSYNQHFRVTDIDKVSINFNTKGRADRLIVQDEFGAILHDTGLGIFTPANNTDLNFDIDVTSLDIISIIVQRGDHVLNVSWEFTAYFKVSYETFTQIPITFEGINQSPNITLGNCDDAHVAWQSNRDRYWNIFYSNATDKLSPFRFDTKITDTTSNSLRPSVAVNRTGARMITWHDDRNGNYDIFAARATTGYSCDDDKCKREQAESFDYDIIECDISIEHEAVAGTYSLSLEFYKDAALNNLYTTINIENDNVDRWFVDSVSATISYDELGVAQGVVFDSDADVVISYIPDKDDGIFDIVLYVKLVLTEITE